MPKRKVQFLPRVDLRLANAHARQSDDSASRSVVSCLARPNATSTDVDTAQLSGNPAYDDGASNEYLLPSTRTGRSSRPDVPVIREHVRASAHRALAVAASPSSYNTALEDLDRDMYAATSIGPREAVWATYRRFHRYAMGEADVSVSNDVVHDALVQDTASTTITRY